MQRKDQPSFRIMRLKDVPFIFFLVTTLFIGNDNPCSEHLELVKILSSVGITDVVPVDGSVFFVRLSCRKNFNCNTAGRKRTQRGVQQENAGIKVHMAFSNVNGTISHLSITEGTGSEREQVRAAEYGEGLLSIKDRGYVDYNEESHYADRSQFYLTRYRTNVQGDVVMAFDGETGQSLDELIGKTPSCELPDNIISEYIDMQVKRINDNGNEVISRVVRVRTPNGEFSYYVCQWIKYQQRQSTFFTDADGKALSLHLRLCNLETE